MLGVLVSLRAQSKQLRLLEASMDLAVGDFFFSRCGR